MSVKVVSVRVSERTHSYPSRLHVTRPAAGWSASAHHTSSFPWPLPEPVRTGSRCRPQPHALSAPSSTPEQVLLRSTAFTTANSTCTTDKPPAPGKVRTHTLRPPYVPRPHASACGATTACSTALSPLITTGARVYCGGVMFCIA